MNIVGVLNDGLLAMPVLALPQSNSQNISNTVVTTFK